MPMPSLSETDFAVLRKIEEGQPVPPNYLIRLELLGLARDEATGSRLTLAGRRALAGHKPAPVASPSVPQEDDDGGTRSRKRKKRYEHLF